MNAVFTHASSYNNDNPEPQKSVEVDNETSIQNNQSAFLAHLMHSKGGLPVLVLSNDGRKTEDSLNMNQGQITTVRGQQVISNEGNSAEFCEVTRCNGALTTTDHLSSHQSNQKGVGGAFKCRYEDCTQAFNTQDKLSVHIETHPGETVFICRETGGGKTFTTDDNLKNHSKIHSEEFPFLCTHQNCGKQFTEYADLKTHKLIHSEDELAPCEICRKDVSHNGPSYVETNIRKSEVQLNKGHNESQTEKGHGESCMNKSHCEMNVNNSQGHCEINVNNSQGHCEINVNNSQGHCEINVNNSQDEVQIDKEHSGNETTKVEIQLNQGDGRVQANTEIDINKDNNKISMRNGHSEIQTHMNNGNNDIQADQKMNPEANSSLTYQNMVVLGSGSSGLPTVNNINSPCDLNSLCVQNVDGQQTVQLLHVGLSTAASWLSNQTVSLPFMINCKTTEKSHVIPDGTEMSKSKNKRNSEVLFLQSGCIQVEELKNLERLTTSRTEKKKEKLYICEVEGCGRSFSSVGYLRYHQAVHEGKKSLQCPVYGCDRTFSWPAHLKYHEKTHSGERNFKCTYEDCDMTFMTYQRLVVHLRVHTGEKPFVCGETGCGKSFTTSGNLKNHCRVHSGERPYICTYPNCGRQFSEHSSLKKHKLVHTGEKPYLCEICGKTFSQSGSRKVHMRGHLELQSNKKRKRLGISHPPNVVVLGSEDILEYQDYQGSESVVFSQPIGEHVVTVTTQPAEGDTSQLDLNRGILGVEDVLTSEECVQNAGMCGVNSTGANVVVLSQPHHMVSIHVGGEFTAGSQDVAGMDPMMETDDESESSVWVEND